MGIPWLSSSYDSAFTSKGAGSENENPASRGAWPVHNNNKAVSKLHSIFTIKKEVIIMRCDRMLMLIMLPYINLSNKCYTP